jgi:hypothetical protein
VSSVSDQPFSRKAVLSSSDSLGAIHRFQVWSGKGVVLPHGTQVRMEYNGRSHSGEIMDGQWHVEGGVYGSPSAAAVGVARNKAGDPISSLDGWIYWSAQFPGSSKWLPISSLRKKAADI